MKRTTFRQCEVRRGNAIRLTWIPAEYAVEGRNLRLRDNGKWSEGWLVVSVYPDTERIVAGSPRRDIRNHRRATGDSLPRLSQ